VSSPNFKTVHDAIAGVVGAKTIDLAHSLLPNLSGQSFIAITHYDPAKPSDVGLIAAMKPKAGTGDFATFLDKLKAAAPDLAHGKTGTDTVDGVGYEWIEPPQASGRICVAQFHGWIVTTWNEAPLQDWIARYRKTALTSSLAQDVDYRKSIARIGDSPLTLVYVNYHALAGMLQSQLASRNPAAADYLAKKTASVGGLAVGTRFENGEIVDRYSFLIPPDEQTEAGAATVPCPFDTLKFTSRDTRFYWARNIDWKQLYKAAQTAPPATGNGGSDSPPTGWLGQVDAWAKAAGLDTERNIIDPLGGEISIQAEWSPDTPTPEAGLFIKVDKPADFKPTLDALIAAIRQNYATSAVVRELNSNGQNFASLQFIQASSFTPTITEDGPYFGLFLTNNQAVRSFQRDASIDLTHNPDFSRQIGDKRATASQIIFLDSPQLLERSYEIAMPYLSIASMFNRDFARLLADKGLPPDLKWLAPIGTWSLVVTPDTEGIEAYSTSGIGNQGLIWGGTGGGAFTLARQMGLLSMLGFSSSSRKAPSAPASMPPSVGPAPALPPMPTLADPHRFKAPPAAPADASGTTATPPPAAAPDTGTAATTPAPMPSADANANVPAAPNTNAPTADAAPTNALLPDATGLTNSPAATNATPDALSPPPEPPKTP
jgi:hypothetical protein